MRLLPRCTTTTSTWPVFKRRLDQLTGAFGRIRRPPVVSDLTLECSDAESEKIDNSDQGRSRGVGPRIAERWTAVSCSATPT
jgi:hypothetical protein